MRKAKRIALSMVVGLAAIVVVVLVFLRTYLTAEFLEDALNSALVPATQSLYRAEVGGLSYAILQGDLVVYNLRIFPVRETIDSLKERGSAPSVQLNSRLDQVSIEGVEIVRLLWRQELAADLFAVSSPSVQITVVGRPNVSNLSNPDSSILPAENLKARDTVSSGTPGYLQRLRHLELRSVRIDQVNVTLIAAGAFGRDTKETNLTNRLVDLSVSLENLIIDPTRPRDLGRMAFAEDVRVNFDLLHLELPGEQILDLGPLTTSTSEQSLQIAGVSVIPTYSEAEMLEGAGTGSDRFEVSTGPISVEGLDFGRIFANLDFRATRAHVEKCRIDVLSDKRRSEDTPSSGRAFMPHDIFRNLPIRMSLDTLKFADASITYSERSVKSDSPGSITINAIDAVISDLSNDRAPEARNKPTVLHASALLFGTTETSIDVDLPLLAPPPSMKLKASVSAFDPMEVNTILPPLEGLRVTKGEVDTAWVTIDYGERKATGSVVAIYRDLDVRMEDRDTGNQNFGDKLGSIFADVGLRGGNEPDPGETPRAGKVDFEITLEKPFFQLFWEAIRNGLTDLVKRF